MRETDRLDSLEALMISRQFKSGQTAGRGYFEWEGKIKISQRGRQQKMDTDTKRQLKRNNIIPCTH